MTLYDRINADLQPEARGRRLGLPDYLDVKRDSRRRAFSTVDLLTPLREERRRFGLSVVVGNAMAGSVQELLPELLANGLNRRDVFSLIAIEEDGRIVYPKELAGETRPLVRFWTDTRDRRSVPFWPIDVLVLPGESESEFEIAHDLADKASLILVDAAGPRTPELLERLGHDGTPNPTFVRTGPNHWIFASARNRDDVSTILATADRCTRSAMETGDCVSNCLAQRNENIARATLAAALARPTKKSRRDSNRDVED